MTARVAAIALAVLGTVTPAAQAPAPGSQARPAAPPRYDLVIRHGRVLDGTGNPWMLADVAIAGDRIAAVGALGDATAAREIDAAGLYVAPGFIDTHTHAGGGMANPALAAAEPLLRQGITTIVVNPDGGGELDIAAQRAAFLKHGLGVNVAQLVPHGSARQRVMGMADRRAEPHEIARMRELVRAGMREGAWGLSAGPFYVPGSYAAPTEYVEVAKASAEYGGVFQSHIRDESDYSVGVLAAIDEVITVAREAKLPGIVTHVKVLGPGVWGFSTPVIRRIERARAEGLEVWADQYPYEASATGLVAALMPAWAQEGGRAALRARLADPAARARIRAEMVENLRRRAGADRIQFRRVAEDPSIEGKTLARVARDRGQEPVDVALALIDTGSPAIVSFGMVESDVRAFMTQPWTMTASDGDLVPMGEGVPHPRVYGTFARKIRRYVVDEPVVGLEDAVRSMTSLPAQVFRMKDRGVLRAGAIADLVVFDLARVRDTATYDKPHQFAEGMVHVFVNGAAAIADGAVTAGRAGRVLRRDRQ